MPSNYIGIKPCGCMVFACADLPPLYKEIAKQIAYCAKHGYSVRQAETEEVRRMPWRCAEHDKSKQVRMEGI